MKLQNPLHDELMRAQLLLRRKLGVSLHKKLTSALYSNIDSVLYLGIINQLSSQLTETTLDSIE